MDLFEIQSGLWESLASNWNLGNKAFKSSVSNKPNRNGTASSFGLQHFLLLCHTWNSHACSAPGGRHKASRVRMELHKTRASSSKARRATGILLHASQNFSRQMPKTVFANMSHPFLQPWVNCVSILCVSQVLPTMVRSPLSVQSGLLYSS